MKSNRVLGEKKHDDYYYYLKKGFFGKEFLRKLWGGGRKDGVSFWIHGIKKKNPHLQSWEE